MPRKRRNLRHEIIQDYAHVTVIPTQILVGALLGFGLGKLLARAFPAQETLCIVGGSLYGLAAGLYLGAKTLLKSARSSSTTPKKHGDSATTEETRRPDDGGGGEDDSPR